MHRYLISGLQVASEVPLVGLIDGATRDRSPEVTVRIGEVPARLEAADKTGITWEMAGPHVLFRVPGVAHFLISHGREIVVDIAPGVDPADVAVFLAGTVFGVLLHQRQRVALHASAVQVGGSAVLFCGPSGAGKSTMAAALNARGFPLLSDDICSLDIGGAGAPLVHPDGRSLKLWADALGKLGMTGQAPVRQKLEKFYVAPSHVESRATPLAAIYALREARPPLSPGIDRPNIVDAAIILRRNAYRSLIVHNMNQQALYFAAAAKVTQEAGLFFLTRELDFGAMDAVIDRLLDHWAEIGLIARPG